LVATFVTKVNTCKVEPRALWANIPAVYTVPLTYLGLFGVYHTWVYSKEVQYGPYYDRILVEWVMHDGTLGGCGCSLQLSTDYTGPQPCEAYSSAAIDGTTIPDPFYVRINDITLSYNSFFCAPGDESCTTPYEWTGDVILTEE
jgi:hypothetical protein